MLLLLGLSAGSLLLALLLALLARKEVVLDELQKQGQVGLLGGHLNVLLLACVVVFQHQLLVLLLEELADFSLVIIEMVDDSVELGTQGIELLRVGYALLLLQLLLLLLLLLGEHLLLVSGLLAVVVAF